MSLIKQLAQECVEIAESKGFDRCTWDNFATKVAFIYTEVDEAIEKLGWKSVEVQGTVGEEFADIAIRTLAILQTLWPEWSSSRIENRGPVKRRRFEQPAQLFVPVTRYLRMALEAWRRDDQKDAQISLELSLLELWKLADEWSMLELSFYVQAKMKQNRERPPLHGKKRTEA
jgi:NTP pyrophosphatase (non-canonical NTP hydrolase)